MKTMPKQTRLQRRNGTYYHRARVPADIADTYPKLEEKLSLKTKDYKVALRRVKLAAIEADEKFEAHRRQQRLLNPVPADEQALDELSEAALASIEDDVLASILKQDEDERWNGFASKPLDRKLPSYSHEDILAADLRDEDLLEMALGQMEFANHQDLLDLKKQVATGNFDKEPAPAKELASSTVHQIEAFVY